MDMQLSSGKGEVIKKEKRRFTDRIFEAFLFKPKTNEADAAEAEEIKQLLESISRTKQEWTRANINFEYADSQEAVDYYTYTIKANEVMYEYLIKKAKEKGIRVDPAEAIEITSNKNMG